MCVENGLRCKCADKPIALCIDLETELAAITKERDELQRVGKENDASYLSTLGEITLLKKERDQLIAERERILEDFDRQKEQLGRCERHAASMARDFDARENSLQALVSANEQGKFKAREERDQLRQRVEELMQILRDCDVTFANGVHRDNPIRRLIAMQLSTKPEGGDEPCEPADQSAPVNQVATESTIQTASASNAAPESSDPTGTAANEPACPGSPESETEQTPWDAAAGIREPGTLTYDPEFVKAAQDTATAQMMDLIADNSNLQTALENARAQERVWRETAEVHAKTLRGIAEPVLGDADLANRGDLPEMVKERFNELEKHINKLERAGRV